LCKMARERKQERGAPYLVISLSGKEEKKIPGEYAKKEKRGGEAQVIENRRGRKRKAEMTFRSRTKGKSSSINVG